MSTFREYKTFRFEVSYYSFDFDYSTETDCEAYGCDSICRCCKIIDAKIEQTNNIKSSIVEIRKLTQKGKRSRWYTYVPTTVESYCVDRLFRLYKLYETTYYDVLVSGGYYGEEISGVDHPNFSDFFNDLNNMLSFEHEIDKVKLVLEREYAFLLPEVKKCSDVQISSKNIKILIDTGSTRDRLSNMKTSNYEYDVIGDEPIGVILGARLIDGHHRACAALKTKQENFNFIEIS